ncbi:tyrosine-protein phosphatase non-receptor type 18-like isoform X3 [Trachypithecus francoisi]|uniref:tyrosine-protein phosphatase non-receptor type 18-like isoform X3 n=1 Tax=Trachypithecus francoisi TaxID=54180 RepID=UPI00141B12F6|nr:tyrosine-protein phosphatase non-receptor type 18-like isoform X3 [Trachypithecus francoisi]
MRKQRPAAVQTEEQYRFLYHTVAQMFCSTLQENASPHYQNIKENCAPLYDDALFLRTPQALLAIPRPPGGVLRSISVPGSPGHAMADTYAVVQKRRAPAGAGPGTETGPGARSAEEVPLYSQVTPRAQRPGAHAEDVRGTVPGRGESRLAPSEGIILLWSAGPWRPRRPPAPMLTWPRPDADVAASLARPGSAPWRSGSRSRGRVPGDTSWPVSAAPNARGHVRGVRLLPPGALGPPLRASGEASSPGVVLGLPGASGADSWRGVSCPQFLLTKVLRHLAPTRTWRVELRPVG